MMVIGVDRLDRGGDRQLNRALHTIAITRAQRDPATKEYLARKEADGKTRKGALRCLKRYLARRFWRLLTEPPLEPALTTKPVLPANLVEPELHPIPQRPVSPREVDHTITGPIPMICIT